MTARQFLLITIYLGSAAISLMVTGLRRVRWPGTHGWSFVLGGFLGMCLTLVSFMATVVQFRPQVTVVETAPPEVRRHTWTLLLQVPLRQDVIDALTQMNAQELTQAYVDVNAAFEESLASSYLAAARNLIDYAFLAERELALRELARPVQLPSPREMLLRFEQLL
jgi:hypothetical protein